MDGADVRMYHGGDLIDYQPSKFLWQLYREHNNDNSASGGYLRYGDKVKIARQYGGDFVGEKK